MLLASWNINSIRARHERFLAWLAARQPATPLLARKCTAASIDRNERKGRQPSDHAPVLATFDLP